MVTLAVQVELLPLLSVTVRVTVLEPTLEQLKLVGVAEVLAMPQASLAVRVTFWLPRVLQLNALGVAESVGGLVQLSLEPPSTSEAVIEAVPPAFTWMVMF